MSRPILVLAGITKDYAQPGGLPRLRVLSGFDLEVTAGQVVGLLGPNGSGKSTALKIILGLVRPQAGRGSIAGAPIGSRAARRRMGYMPEQGGLAAHLTGGEALLSWGTMNSPAVALDPGVVAHWLERVGLSDAAGRRVGTFSKGMRQRLALAQALLLAPDVVLLDEPFAGVDPVGVDLLADLVREQTGRGAAVVLTSHLLHRAERLCDRVVLLDRGRVLARGKVTDLVGGTVSPPPRGLEDVYREALQTGRSA